MTFAIGSVGAGAHPQSRTRGPSRWGGSLCVLMPALLLASCSATADPVTISYALQFPSLSAAVATDSVQVSVVSGREDCLKLLTDFKKGVGFPARTTLSKPGSPCEFAAGKVANIELEFGEYTMLAVGSAKGKPNLYGCAQQRVQEGFQTVSLPLTAFDETVATGVTSCTRLADFCSGGCK